MYRCFITAIGVLACMSSTAFAAEKDYRRLKPNEVRLENLHPASFERTFPQYLRHSTEKVQMARGYDRLFAALHVLDWGDRRRPNDSLLIRDLACGNGIATKKILAALRYRFPHKWIELVAVDHEPRMVTAFRQRFAQHDDGRLVVSVKHGDVFATHNEVLSARRADITVASHMLYHAEPNALGGIINRFVAATAPDGVLSMTMLAMHSDFETIQNEFVRPYAGDRTGNVPVETSLASVKEAILTRPDLAQRTIVLPYRAHLKFPKVTNLVHEFTKWQKRIPRKPPTDENLQISYDLLEFMVHKELSSLREAGLMLHVVERISELFDQNGLDASGHPRLNLDGENVIVFGEHPSPQNILPLLEDASPLVN